MCWIKIGVKKRNRCTSVPSFKDFPRFFFDLIQVRFLQNHSMPIDSLFYLHYLLTQRYSFFRNKTKEIVSPLVTNFQQISKPGSYKKHWRFPEFSSKALVQRVVARRIRTFKSLQSSPCLAKINLIPKMGATHGV